MLVIRALQLAGKKRSRQIRMFQHGDSGDLPRHL